MKKTVLSYEEQYYIADGYILNNTNENVIPLNYKMTSVTWAQMISKWCGGEISIEAVNEACENYGIEKSKLYEGVYVFAMELSKNLANNKNQQKSWD